MSEIRVGPGQPCLSCGEVYGQHEPSCPEARQQKRKRNVADTNLGREVIEAIQNDDAQRLGRLLRSLTDG